MDQSTAAQKEDNATAAGEPQPTSDIPAEPKTEQTAPAQQKQKDTAADDDDDDEESDLDDLDGKQPCQQHTYKKAEAKQVFIRGPRRLL